MADNISAAQAIEKAFLKKIFGEKVKKRNITDCLTFVNLLSFLP